MALAIDPIRIPWVKNMASAPTRVRLLLRFKHPDSGQRIVIIGEMGILGRAINLELPEWLSPNFMDICEPDGWLRIPSVED